MPVIEEGVRYHFKSAKNSKPNEYYALVIPAGFSADIMVTEKPVIDLIKKVRQNGGIIGAIGGGAVPLLAVGVLHGKKCSGNPVVSYMMKEVGRFTDNRTEVDEGIITAKETVDTPLFVRALCSAFDNNFKDRRENCLNGKRIAILTSDEYEDIEVVVPVMEFLYRGASVTAATFQPLTRTRPPLLNNDVIVGSFGTTIPFQEIGLDYYELLPFEDLITDNFDLLLIPGGFNSWNMIEQSTPIDFLRKAFDVGKLIAVICHSEIAAAAADIVRGKKTGGWLASKHSAEIMGGNYSFDRSAVIDGILVSGRTPTDAPEFLDAATYALLLSD